MTFTTSKARKTKLVKISSSSSKVKPAQIGNNFMSLAYLHSVSKKGCKACGH